MENHVQPSDLETDSFSTSHSDGSEPVGKAQVGTFIDSRQSLSSGCCGAREDAQAGAAPACPLPSCTVFDAVSASLVRTLEVEPTDPSCSVEMMCEWCSSFGTVHCITQSLNSRLPRVTVTYIDSRDCQRAKHEFAKLYPAVAIECSSDEAEHDLTGIVLAMQPCPDKAVSPEQVRSMLAVFGPIAWSCAIDPLPTGPPLPITAFEFYCLQDARQAVSALNYGAKNAFCLCQLNKRGHIVPSDTNCGSACRFSGCNTPPGFSQVIPAIPTTLSARTDELVSDSINNPVSDPMSLHSADRPLASAGAAVLSPTLYPTAHSSGMPQHQHCATAPRALSGPSLGQHGAHQHRTASSLPQHLSHNACSAPPDQAMPFVYPDTQHARDALLSILGSYHTPTSNPGSAQASPTPAAVAFSQAAASGAPSAIQSPMNSASLAASLPPSVAASLCGGGNLADPAADFLTEFDPTEAAAGGPRARTTVMIRNIPCRWTAEDLLAVLSGVIGHSWDLLYMPCKNSDVAHAGYAFMNFRAPQDTLGLFNAMHGRCWPNTRSSKICEVRYARIQGRHLLTHLFSHGAPGSTAAAFRGYLAFPANGSVIVHGPNSCVSRSHSKRSKRQGSSRGSRKGAAARSTVCVPHPADAIASMPAPVTWMHQQQSQPQAAHQSVQQQLPMAACGDTSNVWGAALPQMQGQQQQQMGRQHMLPVQNVQRHPRSMPHVMHDNNAAELNSMFSTLPMPQALHHPDSERSFQMQNMLHALMNTVSHQQMK